MAQAILAQSTLRLVFETGVDVKGEPIFKSKTFTNLKKEATPDQMHQAAIALAALCVDPLTSVERNDRSEILG
ncbi:hypothetical protein AM500_14450 [Bacillus sp. FJAT-18017]|uniref:DUF1659 domain-containing protein n=1 Tax=unclassified Bacillus (in: firmicutes) TaxID=185979 RepID=UPI0005C5D442|nr:MULTISPECIES: DUF1659 domain-containing protein [unclassified Bacillus (in: firmicutes)]ALC90853.1 hypothetical protein AM500_14450 [Bacillus sp. FJAT-18017]